MQLTDEQAAEIRSFFAFIDSVQHLAILLNYIYELRFPKRNPNVAVRIESRHLTYYAFQPEIRQYQQFTIAKRGGGQRQISAPRYKLKTIQKCINTLFQIVFQPHNRAFGFIAKRSIVDNARQHVGKGFVYNLDLADFFPSISYHRVRAVLRLSPFKLTDATETTDKTTDKTKVLQGRGYLGFVLANLCCHEGCLPQGAPTSPILSNIAAARLDKRLHSFARREHCTYSRYADDITFSANRDIFTAAFKTELYQIIAEENFTPNLKKERLQPRTVRQTVTGITVNNKLNLPPKYLKDIRYWLHYWKSYGKNAAATKLAELRQAQGRPLAEGKSPANFLHYYLQGKIRFLGMVKGFADAVYLRLMAEIEALAKAAAADNQANNQSDFSTDGQAPTDNQTPPNTYIDTVINTATNIDFVDFEPSNSVQQKIWQLLNLWDDDGLDTAADALRDTDIDTIFP
jgi:retron-type reverse transcriptase